MKRKQPDPNCELCDGTGEVGVYGQVYANEPHMAIIDSKPCLCTLPDYDDDYDDQDPDDGGSIGVRPINPEPKNDGGGNVPSPYNLPETEKVN